MLEVVIVEPLAGTFCCTKLKLFLNSIYPRKVGFIIDCFPFVKWEIKYRSPTISFTLMLAYLALARSNRCFSFREAFGEYPQAPLTCTEVRLSSFTNERQGVVPVTPLLSPSRFDLECLKRLRYFSEVGTVCAKQFAVSFVGNFDDAASIPNMLKISIVDNLANFGIRVEWVCSVRDLSSEVCELEFCNGERAGVCHGILLMKMMLTLCLFL